MFATSMENPPLRFLVASVVMMSAPAISLGSQEQSFDRHFKAEVIIRYVDGERYYAAGVDTLSGAWYSCSTKNPTEINLDGKVTEVIETSKQSGHKDHTKILHGSVSKNVFPGHWLMMLSQKGLLTLKRVEDSGEHIYEATNRMKDWTTNEAFVSFPDVTYELRVDAVGHLLAYHDLGNGQWIFLQDLNPGAPLQVSQLASGGKWELVELREGKPGSGFQRADILQLRKDLTSLQSQENHQKAQGNLLKKPKSPEPSADIAAGSVVIYKPPPYTGYRWMLLWAGLAVACAAAFFKLRSPRS